MAGRTREIEEERAEKGPKAKVTDEEKKKGLQDDDSKIMEEVLNRELLERIDKLKDDRIQTLETSVFQLANYYFVFQGVFFTAVFQGSSQVKCHFRYLAFSLSLLAAFVNLIALFVIALRHLSLLRELDVLEDEWTSMAKLNQRDRESCWKKYYRLGLLILTMSLLALFAGFNLHGTWKFLCYENQQCVCSSKECVKLCN